MLPSANTIAADAPATSVSATFSSKRVWRVRARAGVGPRAAPPAAGADAQADERGGSQPAQRADCPALMRPGQPAWAPTGTACPRGGPLGCVSREFGRADTVAATGGRRGREDVSSLALPK